MSPRCASRSASGLQIQIGSKNPGGGWNRPALRAVVQGVGNWKGAAALVAGCVVLSGCASGDGGSSTTTSSPVAQGASNPWDLPLEQRPPLFDPCEEIPVEAVEEGVGAPVKPDPDLTRSEPGSLVACGWSTDEIMIHILSTWKSYRDYLAEPTGYIRDMNVSIKGRSAMILSGTNVENGAGKDPNVCRYLLFTEKGTVVISVGFINSLNSFRGESFAKSCHVLQEVGAPLVEFLPEGEFR